MIEYLLAMVSSVRHTTCEWCGRWTLFGYRVIVKGKEKVFCSWPHYLAWISRQDKNDE